MNIVFCIGNGPSIKDIDLTILKPIGPTYGCNNLIETFDVDNTVIVDKHLLIDLISKGYNKKTNIYTRDRWKNLIDVENIKFLSDPILDPKVKWDNENHWGSGTHALNLAASHKAEIIIMLGYDLYNKDLDPSCWIYQIEQCFKKYPNIQFVQVQKNDWQCPQSWNADNFLMDDIGGLEKMLGELI